MSLRRASTFFLPPPQVWLHWRRCRAMGGPESRPGARSHGSLLDPARRVPVPLRVLLADDHVLVRDGTKITLEVSGFTIVGEASEGREAVKMARELKPDAAAFDVSMPGLNGA